MKQPNLNPSKSTGLKMSKKKRKFRAMTVKEYCDTVGCDKCSYYDECFGEKSSYYPITKMVERKFNDKTFYITEDGKYILREIKE